MGILNVTPDSVSDGGCWADPSVAVRHAMDMIDAGADIIDIGGESTRPNSEPVSADDEIARLEPVLRDLVPSVSVPISVDTMKTRVAERCISMGVDIVNDVYGLRDAGMPELCASAGVHAVIMHMHGMPKSMPVAMQGDFMNEIRDFLRERTEVALDAGIRADHLVMDPGIGFGKDPDQNLEILENSSFFSDGYPVLSGSSRKRFLATKFPGMGRDEASVEAALVASGSGADIVRVHDVASVSKRMRCPDVRSCELHDHADRDHDGAYNDRRAPEAVFLALLIPLAFRLPRSAFLVAILLAEGDGIPAESAMGVFGKSKTGNHGARYNFANR